MTIWMAVVLSLASAQESEPVAVLHEFKPCVTYRASLSGEYLVIRATLEPGWHTFAMDNVRRAEEKLAGKQSLGIDQPTEIAVSGALEIARPWYQSPPKDFSKPELRWYSWGFENQAVFAAKFRRKAPGPAQIALHGQACTDTTCKNVEVTIALPSAVKPLAPLDVKTLVPVR
jgi:hypothetical protein